MTLPKTDFKLDKPQLIWRINTTDVTADRLAEVYMKIRTKRSELAAAFDAEDSELKEKQRLITAELLRICKETGAESIKTKHGTISRYVKERFWCSDFPPLLS